MRDRRPCRGVQISPPRPLRPLHPWHPDPAQRKLVAWLCSGCRRIVRATREPVVLTWKWPGLTAARSRKPADLPHHVSATLAALDANLPPSTTTALRDSAFIGILMRALAPGERERLYAAGSLAGPRWQPTCETRLDALLRGWVFTERAERDTAARAAGGITVIPQPEAPRRRREVVPQPPPPASSPLSQPFDPEASFAAIQRAIERLDEAEAAAVQTNARVVEAIRNRFG